MSEQIKFSEEEMKNFQDLQVSYQNNIIAFGQMQLRGYMIDDEIKKLKDDETKLKDEYKALQNREDELLNAITSKYGEGSLDIKSGLFTPTSK